MFKVLCYVLLLATKVVYISLQSCNYVSDTVVEFRVAGNLTSIWNRTKVSDCISDASFNITNIAHIGVVCRRGSVLVLEKKFIANMETLKLIYIDDCHIETIKPGAFLNLPQLERIRIASNPFSTISKGVFNILPSLQTLQILRTKLSHIEDDSFANLPNLRKIEIEESSLNYIKREWFTNTSNIEIFSVFKNLIHTIPLGMFHGWTKLKQISLNHNAISVIEGELFKNNPPVIKYVEFHQNHLTSLLPSTFPDSVFIDHLSVSANLLNFIPEDLLVKIRVANINIFGNPFDCSCLENIQRILLERGTSVDGQDSISNLCKGNRNVPVCGQSSNSSRICSESVNKELTRLIISNWKEIQYDTVQDKFKQKCAMFDNID